MMRTGSRSSGRSGSGTPGRVPEKVLAGIDRHLKGRETRRDALHQRARILRRRAQGAMGRIHEGENQTKELSEIRREARDLSDWLRSHSRGDEGLAMDALQESVEAILLGAVMEGSELPGPEEIGVDPEPYLLGLGDVVGEVRRLALDRLGSGDVDGAEARLRTMEHLFRALMRFDTTRAIVSLKPKQDVARSLLEKTRVDVTMAKMLRARPGSEERDR